MLTLPVHRDQLWAPHTVTSMVEVYLLLFCMWHYYSCQTFSWCSVSFDFCDGFRQITVNNVVALVITLICRCGCYTGFLCLAIEHLCMLSDYIFSTRCNIYISRLCYDVIVRLSVTEVHWHIIANSNPNLPHIVAAAHNAPACTASQIACGHIVVTVHVGERRGVISRYARPSCIYCCRCDHNRQNW